jgi:cell wall-associated NlpC family hydrolase
MVLKIPVKTISYQMFAETGLTSVRTVHLLALAFAALLLAACSSPPIRTGGTADSAPVSRSEPAAPSDKAFDVVLYALGLIDTGYRYGGKNPEAGLDCSGMVSHIFNTAAGIPVQGSAADIARSAREIDRSALRPGDLVFFNTRNRPFSHVGIYIGDARFVHAPSTNGRVRIDRLNDRYYAQRFEAARTFFD